MTSAAITAGVTREWVVAPDRAGARQRHASTLLAVDDRLLCAWFAGTEEGTTDNRIYVAARDAANTWQAPSPIRSTEATAHWNPVLAHAPNGEIWLFFKRGDRISSWTTWLCTSADGGLSWSDARELVSGDTDPRGPVKNPPVLASDGAWLAPGSTETWNATGTVWESFVDRSIDGGLTWQKVAIPLDRSRLTGAGVIQPALWAAGTTIGALLRSSEGCAFVSISTDNGRTFPSALPSSLPNNNSGLTVASLPNGLLAAVHNPSTTSWGTRCPLSVAVSADGHDWQTAVVIEDGRTPLGAFAPSLPAASTTGFEPRDAGVRTDGIGEYSYPAAVVVGEHLIVTYTWQRRAIVCAAVPLNLLVQPQPNRKASHDRTNC
jgi:predicted neuraminidase